MSIKPGEAQYAEIQDRWVNYEDLAYLAGQVSDDLADEYENPALRPFVRDALIDLSGLFQVAPKAAREQLRELAGSAVDYIRQVVALLLNQAPTKTCHLQIFVEACQDPLISEVNLFTLNHDTMLEDFLRKNGVTVVDGLRDASNGSRRWDPPVFDTPNGGRRVNLFKLHGSISWVRWAPGPEGSQDTLRENADGRGRWVGSHPKEHALLDEGIVLLAGTFNKILDYNSEIFLELHHRFHRTLQDCKTLVICGYGFGDKGINTRIAEWRHQPSNPKLLIIDPADHAKIVQKARGAIGREIADLNPQTVHWQKSFGDGTITWQCIRAVLQDC